MRNVILAIIFVLVAGCSSPERLVESRTLVERSAISLPDVAPASQIPQEFVVLTKDNVETKFKELEASGTVVVFGMTPEGYQALQMNLSELRRYIQQKDSVVAAYKEYYEVPLSSPVKDPKPFWRIW